MSTLGHVQYIRDIIMNVGGYHVYIGGCSVHRRNIISTLGGGGGGGRNIMSTLGDVQRIRWIS